MSDHDTFGKLVQDDKDFIGMVAYTIYKKEKNNWKDSYKQQNSRDATYDEIRQFFNVDTTTPQKIAAYRSLAENRLNTFIDETLTAELEQYKEIVRNEEIVKAVKTPWWRSVIDNVISGIIAAALVSLVSLLYWLNDIKEDSKFQKDLYQKLGQIMEINKPNAKTESLPK